MKRHVRLAVLFDQEVYAGGGYQQALNAALIVKRLPKNLVETIYYTTHINNIKTLSGYGIEAKLISSGIIIRILMRLHNIINNSFLCRLLKIPFAVNPFENKLIKDKIDLVYFLSPSGFARSLEKINYITTVWDLCHRDELEFPEVRWNRQFEIRESNYKAILPRAVAVLVDSDLGKRNVIARYGIDNSRVYIMPFEGSSEIRLAANSKTEEFLDIKAKYELEHSYIFYPAQFWAHKNHIYILDGLKELENKYNIKICAVFSGGDKGNKDYVISYAKEVNLYDRIHFVGFVSKKEIIDLYINSIALVMPSYFGPTNLPPLEAFGLGVPVLYSSKLAISQDIEDAVLKMDLNDPETMAESLYKIIVDDACKRRIIQAGYSKFINVQSIDRVRIIENIIRDFQRRRLTWK